jgi:hypothetical protein
MSELESLALPPLPPEIAEILEAERAPPAPSASARARIFARLGATLGCPPDGGNGAAGGDGGGAVVDDGGAAAAPTALGALPAKSILLAVSLFLAGAGAGAGFYHLANPPKTEAAAPVAHDEPTPPPPSLPAAAPEPAGTPAATEEPIAPTPRPARRSPAPSALGAERAHDTDDAALARERTLVEAARTALTRSDGAAALQLLGQHEREFATGRLAEEREALRVPALVLLGRLAEARQRGAEFYRSYPRSMLRPVVAAALRDVVE